MSAPADSHQNVDSLYKGTRDVPWFREKPTLSWPALELLHKYSKYRPEEVHDAVISLV